MSHYKHHKHHRRYNPIHVPEGWEHYWSKYPNGYTLLEALLSWTNQVNDMIHSLNNYSDEVTTLDRNFRALEKELRASWKGYKEHTEKTYTDFREEVMTIVNNWISTIEPTIQTEVVKSLVQWLDDGTLADIINEDVFDMKANQSDLDITNQKLVGYVTPQMFGAVGDNVADDTIPIKNCYAFAKQNNVNVVFPKVEVGYKVTDSIIFDGEIDVVMDSPVINHSQADKVILSVGNYEKTTHRLNLKLNAYQWYDWNNGYDVDWSTEESVAIRLVNLIESNINIVEASNCTVGLQVIGDNRGFSYNKLNIQLLNNNKYAIDLISRNTGGFVTETLFLGGRVGCFSAVNRDQSRYGVRSRMYNTNFFDALSFDKQSFELHHDMLNEGAEAVPFLLEDMVECQFVNFRTERNSPEVMAYTKRCRNIDFDPLKMSRSSGSILNETPYFLIGERNTVINKKLYQEIDIVRYDNLLNNVHERPTNTGNPEDNNRVLLNGLFNVFFTDGGPFSKELHLREFMQYQAESPIKDNGLLMNGYFRIQNIGVGIDTSNHKEFKIIKNGNARMAVLCFDDGGNYIVPSVDSKLVQGAFLEYDAQYFGGYYTQKNVGTHQYKDVEITVDDVVKKIIIVFGASERATPLNSIAIKAIFYNKNLESNNYVASIWEPIKTFRHNFPYALSRPIFGTYKKGDFVWNIGDLNHDIIGWRRLTDGNSHVDGVDWLAV